MPKKSTNQLIEDLTKVVHKGLAESHREIEGLAVSVKKGFDEVHGELGEIHSELREVNTRLTKIENGHIGRIERLEDDMSRVKVKVGIR